jgi:hypothetical protein
MANALIPALGVAIGLLTLLFFMAVFVSPIISRRMIERGDGPTVISEAVRGDEAVRRKIDYYRSHGYALQSHYPRRMWGRLTSTLTFVKTETRPETVLNGH